MSVSEEGKDGEAG